jgi:hypothetical protein
MVARPPSGISYADAATPAKNAQNSILSAQAAVKGDICCWHKGAATCLNHAFVVRSSRNNRPWRYACMCAYVPMRTEIRT